MSDSGEMAPFYQALFQGYPEKNQTLEKAFHWGLGILGGIGSGCLRNYFMKRPMYAGVQTHIGLGLAFAFCLEQFRQYNRVRYQRREAILRHYVMLHPEDFPEPENRMISEIFEEWNARR